jgi:hypothetical protein
MLWARPQRICGIELYDLIGGDLSRFPSVDRLRRWEDYVPPDAPSISTER